MDLDEFLEDAYPDISKEKFRINLEKLLGMLNITLGERTHTYTLYNPRMKNVVLPLAFVKEIESVVSENGELTNYTFNPGLGMVLFNDVLDVEVLTINYVTEISESYIKASIIPVVLDMIRYYDMPESERNISSIREGDVSIGYDNGSSLHTIILNRINTIKTDLNNCSVMII